MTGKSRFAPLVGVLVGIVVVIGALWWVGSFQSDSPNETTITVAAASDLYYAFREVREEFEDQHPVQVRFNFGSSGLLAQQIHEGAPVDVYASANRDYVQELIDADRMESQDTYLYARGYLVLLGAEGLSVGSLEHWEPSNNQRLAIANPAHAPYGTAAKQALESVGKWDTLQENIVVAESVQHAFELVRRGDAEFGLTALSLVKEEQTDHWVRIDGNHHEPIDQEVGIPRTASNPKAAREFVKFLRSSRGRNLLSNYGFTFPEDSE